MTKGVRDQKVRRNDYDEVVPLGIITKTRRVTLCCPYFLGT